MSIEHLKMVLYVNRTCLKTMIEYFGVHHMISNFRSSTEYLNSFFSILHAHQIWNQANPYPTPSSSSIQL